MVSVNVIAATSPVSFTGSYSQNFDGLLPTPIPADRLTLPSASVLPAGWTVIESGTNNDNSIQIDSGASGTGDTFLYGATGSNERALGSFSSGSMTSQYGIALLNSTGSAITNFAISYIGEQWKNGLSTGALTNTLKFEYSTTATSLTDATVGAFTEVPSLTFTAPQAGTGSTDVTLDGNLVANQQSRSATLSGVNWPAGSVLYLRWTDVNETGNDDSLAVDNFSITVNASPSFGAASYTFSVAENSASGTSIGSVGATDPDAGQTITYSLSGTGSSNFAINPQSGAISVASGANLNFEDTASYSLMVTATDNGTPAASSTVPVTINLTNVNEAPTFGAASYTFSVAENSASGANVGSVSATDPDAGTTLTYSLSGPGSSNFAISSTGAITIASGAALDFETTPSYSLTVTASDGSLSATAPVTINLSNVNEAPAFGAASYTFSVAENSASGASVGSVSAVDPDAGTTLTYSLSGPGSSNFAISSTGVITVATGAALDFETIPSYSLTVTASDGSLSATAPVTINLSNVNEAPAFGAASYTFSVAENSASDASVGSVSAVDPDASTTLTYSLSGTGSSNFAISSTGVITVATGAALDFETTPSYSLTVTVSDGSLSATAPVTINLTNVNEAPTFGAASYTFSVAENSSAGASVGSVSASDPDAGTTLTYSLSGTGSTLFTISSTGVITVASGAALNFESTPSYSLTVTASDGSLSATAPVTINLTNINEAPAFGAASYTFSVAENSASGASVGSVSATDPDANTTLTYSLSGTGSSNFAISSTGVITVASGAVLDFETTPSYSLTVTANDGSLSTTAPVTINLTNVNEAPTFGAASYTFSVAENSAAGASVGSVSATDPDAGTTLTYSLSGTGSSNFAISPTGVITVASGAAFDFETTPSYSLTVTASDGSLSATAPVTINLSNVNEAPTDINLSDNRVADNATAGTPIGTLSSVDPDAGDTHTYFLISGADAASFAIVGNELRTSVAYDGSKPSYSINITSVDSGTASLAKVFTIDRVAGVNVAPTALTLDNNTVAENSTTPVGILSATDANPADTFTYSLVAGTGDTDNALFAIEVINSKTAYLKFASTPDFEFKPTYSIRVRVADQAGLAFERSLTINVTNVNEAPVFGAASYTFSVAENSAAGASVGNASASDPDAGTSLTYTLSGPGSSNFAISSTGVITVATGATLNFESTPSYSLTVTASDGSSTATAPVTIDLTNVNELPTFGAASYTFSVTENSAAGASVGSVSATDPDAGTTLTYSLAGTGSSNFAISSLGVITVATGATLNFEATPSYSLTVTASDGSLSATVPVTVNVTNVNEAPTFGAASYAFSLAENSAAGSSVGSVSATDPDAGSNLTYSLSGTGSSNFAISSTGVITVAAGASLNFESTPVYSLTVTATDNGSPVANSTVPVTINLTNVNEVPVFGAPSYLFSIAENSAPGTNVGSVTASDPDAGSMLTYSIDGGSSTFAINPSTGAISVAAGASINYESITSYSLLVRVTDNGSPVLFATRSVTINVTDIVEAGPTNLILSNSRILENAGANALIGSLSASQAGTGHTYRFALVSGPGDADNGAFTIVGNQLRANASFDFETKTSYVIRVMVTDENNQTLERNFNIQVLDVNESPTNQPPTNITLSNNQIQENAGVNAVVGNLSATDPNAGDTFVFELVAGFGDNAQFNINGTQLRANSSFDFEARSSYSVRVRVMDRAGASITRDFTIQVVDVLETPNNQAPTNIFLSNSRIRENSGANALIGTLSATDPNAGETFTFELVPGFGDNAQFSIAGTQLRAISSFDYEAKTSYSIRVKVTDRAGASITRDFTIQILDVAGA